MDAMDISTQPDAPPGPSAAAAEAAAASASAAAAASSLGASLGLSEPGLDEGKKAGAAIMSLQVAGSRAKRPKVTHSLFFENDNGLKKVLRTFPKIKVQGKGHEYQDLTLLLRHYKKWFQDLYPYGDHFEDLTWKARQVLEDKEKEDDGTTSDPRERLHAFRFQYKNGPAEPEDLPAAKNTGAQLSDEVRARIEANRQKALELKRQREAQSSTAATTTAAPEELDMEALWRIEEERAEAERRQGASKRPAPASFDDEEDDPFGFGGGFGGGFDDDFGGSAPAPAKAVTKAPAPPAFDDEEDVFGFGGFDDDDGAPPPSKQPPMSSQPGAAPEAPKPEPTPAASVPVAAAAPAFAAFDEEEEDAFGFCGGGFDDA